MFIFLIRVLILLLLLVLGFTTYKYLTNPNLRLRQAQRKKKLLFVDDAKNFRKNFHITYKGIVFQGEKYIDPQRKDYKILSIFIWPENIEEIHNLKQEDFKIIEKEIQKYYPTTILDWKSPIKELLNKDDA
ncbi:MULTISPECIES: hypothetical protein [Bacillus]|uniref:hypothetical protein n=1 Tax=Bacillus TaxID=1386 RepID=UPI00031CE2CA|nr:MULTISPECIES: hypothetical protein [Bacillus]